MVPDQQPQSVPDFKQNEWKLEHLIHASSKTEAMAPTTLYSRRAGTQHVHASRIGTEEASHNGNWNHRRLVAHSLTQESKEEPYKMAGFTLPNEEFWLERNTTLPPKELQKMVFPFIEDLFPGNQDWAKWIENIMEDNPEDLHRPQSSRADYPVESIPAMRLMLVLAHLRKVVLQDAVVLLRITDDPLCLYSQHDVFTTLPVFSSIMFKEYSLLLQESIQDARSPLINEHRSVKTALWTLEAFMRQHFDKVERKFEGISRQLASISQAIDQLHGGTMNQSIEHQQQVQPQPQPQQQESQPMSDDDMDGEEQNSADEHEHGQEQEQQVSVEPSEEDLVILEEEIALIMTQVQPRNQGFKMKPRDASLEDHFEEWFAGEPPERPSIWKMNNVFKKSWRKGWAGVDRNHYAFKKRLIKEVIRSIHKAEGPTLEVKITNGLSAVQRAVERAGSISKHNKMLQHRREE
ncbi:MAG: hypothetical protein J3Q66DRAFT_382746 [Benniella sp.]|nr:MAG: hypothetical protein J3Q66DRAFT_382746 [Benniella sp.]